MFWLIVFPFQLTVLLIIIVMAAAVHFAPRFHWPRMRACLLILFISFPMFIPACTSILFVVNHFRFGDFDYKDYQAVPNNSLDRHLKMYLPEAAKNIHARIGAAGFYARYRISKDGLDAWMKKEWDIYKQYRGDTERKYKAPYPIQDDELEYIRSFFHDFPTTITAGLLQYKGPRQDDGGGSDIYFDEKTETAFQNTGYW